MQLTSLQKLNKETILFHEAVVNQHNHERIKIEVKQYISGKPGPLVIETPFLFSFGVQERMDGENNTVEGYTLPVCLWGTEGEPTPEQRSFYDGLTRLQNICHKYLEENFEADLSEALSNILHEKESKSPILYTKLIYSKKLKKILSLFRSKDNPKDNPFDYLKQYCKVKMALIIE